MKEQALDEIPHHPGLAVFTAPKVTKREGKWGKDRIVVAGEMWTIPDSDPYGVFRSLRGGVGLPSFANLEFSRLFNEILVHYQSFSGWQVKELEFVGRGNHPAFHESRDDMQIRIITCWQTKYDDHKLNSEF